MVLWRETLTLSADIWVVVSIATAVTFLFHEITVYQCSNDLTQIEKREVVRTLINRYLMKQEHDCRRNRYDNPDVGPQIVEGTI